MQSVWSSASLRWCHHSGASAFVSILHLYPYCERRLCPLNDVGLSPCIHTAICLLSTNDPHTNELLHTMISLQNFRVWKHTDPHTPQQRPYKVFGCTCIRDRLLHVLAVVNIANMENFLFRLVAAMASPGRAEFSSSSSSISSNFCQGSWHGCTAGCGRMKDQVQHPHVSVGWKSNLDCLCCMILQVNGDLHCRWRCRCGCRCGWMETCIA